MNQINSVDSNATLRKLAEKFDHTFSHLFIFRNIFAQGHMFDAVTVAHNFIIFHLSSLIR